MNFYIIKRFDSPIVIRIPRELKYYSRVKLLSAKIENKFPQVKYIAIESENFIHPSVINGEAREIHAVCEKNEKEFEFDCKESTTNLLLNPNVSEIRIKLLNENLDPIVFSNLFLNLHFIFT